MSRIVGCVTAIICFACLAMQLIYVLNDNFVKATYYTAMAVLFYLITKENREK